MHYAIVIHRDPGSAYGVTVPDLPGCFSAGDTLEEAIESAREAIALHLEELLLAGEPIPERRSIEGHRANEDFGDGVWALVSADVAKLSSKSKRVNITLPERVLAIVDQAAVREGESRSGWLARAALSYVQRRAEAGAWGILTDKSESRGSYRVESRQRRSRRWTGGE